MNFVMQFLFSFLLLLFLSNIIFVDEHKCFHAIQFNAFTLIFIFMQIKFQQDEPILLLTPASQSMALITNSVIIVCQSL